MNETSGTSTQVNSSVTPRSTCSQESEPGVTHYAQPDGATTAPAGPAVAPASRSARQASDAGLLTSGTYGPRSSISSKSADLQRSLESRLVARTASLGSTLYTLTWKVRTTPQQRSICALRASALRISDSDSTSSQQTPLAGWVTPTTRDWKDTACDIRPRADNGKERFDQLPRQANLAGWPTPTAQSPNSLRGVGQDPMRRKEQGHAVNLTDAIHYVDLQSPARLTASGELLTGSSAGMPSGGQLSPRHSLWLIGLPTVWEDCALTVTPSSAPSQPSS